MFNSAPAQMRQERAQRAESPVLTTAARTFAHAPPEMCGFAVAPNWDMMMVLVAVVGTRGA
eukprot:13717571-Alexandrium_andersonii.AAC.1